VGLSVGTAWDLEAEEAKERNEARSRPERGEARMDCMVGGTSCRMNSAGRLDPEFAVANHR